nr:MAG TPA: hypothetical protein [Caudoviricetes sp.]
MSYNCRTILKTSIISRKQKDYSCQNKRTLAD